MKKICFIILLFLLPFISAAADYKGHISWEITDMEYSAFTVDFNLQVRIIGDAVDKCESKVIMPVIETSRNLHSFPYILISGNNKRHMYKRWNSLKGRDNNNYLDLYTEIQSSKNRDTIITYQLQIPKEEWLPGARIVLKEETFTCGNDIYSMDYLVRENVLQKELTPMPEPVIPLPAEPQIQTQHTEKEIFHHLNRSEIDFNYKHNQSEAQDIINLINNSSVRITAINIIGYASPEGPYDFNEKLAMNRAISLKKYVHQHTRLDEEIVHINWIAENWKGLLELLRNTDIPNKYGAISIIENNAIPVAERHNYIKLIDNGQTYNLLLKEFYPQLRKVECHIYYETNNRTTQSGNNLQRKEFLFY